MIASKLAGSTNQPEMKPIYTRASESADAYAALESVLACIANRPPRNWTDMDTERYLARLNDLGDLFKKDQRQFAFDSLLTLEQRKRSTELANLIKKQLIDNEVCDPDVVKGALNILNQKYFIEPNNDKSKE